MTPQLTIPPYGSIKGANPHDWWHHTFNAWWGCQKVSRACKNCYAETIANHFHPDKKLWRGERKMMADANWKKPMTWQRKAEKAGEMQLVFCGSMMDVFEDRDDLKEPRARLFALIDQTPNLLWQLTTKRPENALPMLWLYKGGWQFIPKNIQIVVTLESAAEYNNRRSHVDEMSTVLPVQLSIELCFWHPSEVREFFQQANLDNISRIIAGGESGDKAEPSDIDAFRAWRDGCKAHGIPFFFKQHGKHVWASQDPSDSSVSFHWIDCTHILTAIKSRQNTDA